MYKIFSSPPKKLQLHEVHDFKVHDFFFLCFFFCFLKYQKLRKSSSLKLLLKSSVSQKRHFVLGGCCPWCWNVMHLATQALPAGKLYRTKLTADKELFILNSVTLIQHICIDSFQRTLVFCYNVLNTNILLVEDATQLFFCQASRFHSSAVYVWLSTHAVLVLVDLTFMLTNIFPLRISKKEK